MQRPRHRDLVVARRAVAVIVMAVLVGSLTGCRDQPSSSPYGATSEYHRQLESTGRRVIISDVDGAERVKLRRRSASLKVYDSQLAPVGQVSWRSAPAASEARAIVDVKRVDRPAETSRIESVDGDFEMRGRFRIERSNGGWAVRVDDSGLVGVFESVADGRWEFRRSYQAAEPWTVERGQPSVPASIVRGGETVAHSRGGELSELELLAFELQELSLLERAAIGVWLEKARPVDES